MLVQEDELHSHNISTDNKWFENVSAELKHPVDWEAGQCSLVEMERRHRCIMTEISDGGGRSKLRCSETSVTSNQATRCNYPEHSNFIPAALRT
jgi:hypothetical protein